MGRGKQLSETISNIIALKNAGKQTKEISEQLKLCDGVMRWYVARWKGGGCSAIPSQKKTSGRPHKTSKHVDNILKRELEEDPHISAQKIKENNIDLFSELSVRTVSCCVQELGYTSHQPVKKPILNRVQKARRVCYSLKYLEWDDAQV